MIMIPVIAAETLEIIKDIALGIGAISSVKGSVDSKNAEAVNRSAQEQNDRNTLRFEACSDRLEEELENLGKQRMVISKNLKVFSDAFALIHGQPDFSSFEKPTFPKFDFDEIKTISFVSEQLLTAGIGAIDGAILASVATTGIIPTAVTLGTAKVGKFVELCAKPLMSHSLANLGGSVIIKKGGSSLSKIIINPMAVTNVVTIAAPIISGLLMAYSGSVSLKKADEAKQQVQENEKLINECIQEQMELARAANAMKTATVQVYNTTYKPYVIKMRDLVRKNSEWQTYTADEKAIVENCILAVQILHYLNNVPLCIASEDDQGNVEAAKLNEEGIDLAIKQANEDIGR